jgi:hypothetical protein
MTPSSKPPRVFRCRSADGGRPEAAGGPGGQRGGHLGALAVEVGTGLAQGLDGILGSGD